jgi:hypothetical protein
MNAKTKTGLEIIEAALLLGLLGDALLRATPWGLNVLLWIGALVAAMVALTFRRKRELWSAESIALHGALLFFAAGFVWRDSLTLQVLDVLIMLVILTILTFPALDIKAHLAGFLQYAAAAVSSAVNVMVAPLMLVFGDVEWKTIPQSGWTKHAVAVLRGLAIAAPLVLIFGALFMAADAVFEGIINNTFNVAPETIFSHVLLFGFLTWICAGYLRGALFGSILNSLVVYEAPAQPSNGEETPKEEPIKAEKKEWADYLPDFFRLGTIEVAIVLGLINLLFLSFVVVQIRYFFGGMDLVQTTENFKLSEYARRGFFELCWVAALVLPILLTTHFLLKKDNGWNEKLFRILALINIGLLFVIMFSAVNRMLLYTGNLGYGMTTMRLYPTAFMLWLALVFIWFGLTVLRGQHQRFAWGALWTALFVVAGLHVLNPDHFIVRHNVKLMEQGRQFDAEYNAQLSDDATQVLTENLSKMSFENQCFVKHRIVERLQEQDTTKDFRTFNLSRWNARQTLINYDGSFDTAECPKWTQRSRRDFDHF